MSTETDIPDTSEPVETAPQGNPLYPWLVIALMLIGSAWILAARGMIPWCKWDSPLWLVSLDAWSKHNSQHLLDPYSFSHYLHGFVFYWAFYYILRKRMPLLWILVLAVAVECGWELLENSPTIIDKYRESTASLEYYGDSILNTMGDILCCIVGFFHCHKIKLRTSIGLFIAVEVFMLWWIRDSLIVNVIMLTYPLEAIKVWQMGGG